MSDPLSNYLMEGTRHATLSAETLELMGKQAANRLLNDGIPMNETISKLAAEHRDISGEQVRRICEFANQATYLAKHDQSKTAGAASSYPQFDLADASRIIQDMSDGARPTVTTKTDLEYAKLPSKAKTASAQRISAAEALRENVVEMVFGKVDPKKELHFGKETIAHQLITTKDDLNALKAELEEQQAVHAMQLKEAQAAYYHNVKQHILDGGDFSEIVMAAQTAESDQVKIAETLRPIIERLLVEKIASPSVLRSMTERLEKIAHRIVNQQHPLVSEFRDLVSFGAEVEKLGMALESVQEQFDRVDGFIRETYFARPTR